MTMLSAATPVAAGVFDLLQDATLQAAVNGHIADDIAQDTPRPYIWIEVFNEVDRRGFGTGDLPEVDLRFHVFSDQGSLAEANEIARQIKALVKDASIAIAGYTQCGRIRYDNTEMLANQSLNGVQVHEVVVMCTVWCEQ